jgi:hypothetical protein
MSRQNNGIHPTTQKALNRSNPLAFSNWSRDAIGHRVESFSVQLITVILIYLDFISCAVIAILELMDVGGNLYQRLDTPSSSSNNPMAMMDPSSVGLLCSSQWICSLVLYILKSFTGFTMVYLTLEVIAVVYAFGFKKVHNAVGYSMDVFIVLILCLCSLFQQTQEMNRRNHGKNSALRFAFSSWSHAIMYCGAIRLLGCLRIWRLVRLVTLILDDSLDSLEKTKDELNMARKLMEEMKIQQKSSSQIETSIDETSRTIENLRNEIETLEEALKIAAIDMASYRITLDDAESLVSTTEEKRSPLQLTSIMEEEEIAEELESNLLEKPEMNASKIILEETADAVQPNVLPNPSNDTVVVVVVQEAFVLDPKTVVTFNSSMHDDEHFEFSETNVGDSK